MDEGLGNKFFSDLGALLHEKPEVDGLIQDFENVGLKRNQTDTAMEDVKDLRSDGDYGIGNRNMKHPIRLDTEDCSFFIRTGTCKFGRACKFNHPVSKIDEGKSNKLGAGSSSKSLSLIPCKFFPAGFCKNGESCRFSHSKSVPENSLPQLNILGLPQRWGYRNCLFYMRTGICGYGTSCRFNHPQPIFYTVESMDSYEEASEINDAGYVPHVSESITSHERVLKFGSFPCDFSVFQGKNGHSLIDGSTSESPSGDVNTGESSLYL